MLSYAACLYTERYQGDLHYPAVFSSLMLTSQSKNVWSEHHGAVTCLDFIQGNENMMVTASDYGEIMIHQKNGDKLRSSLIFNDKQYDFRFLTVSQLGDILAVSRTGHLVIIKNLKAKTIVPLEMVNQGLHRREGGRVQRALRQPISGSQVWLHRRCDRTAQYSFPHLSWSGSACY